MNPSKALCWFAAFVTIITIILIGESRRANDEPDYQTYPEMVEQRQADLKLAE